MVEAPEKYKDLTNTSSRMKVVINQHSPAGPLLSSVTTVTMVRVI
jgi:hypothetical protein